MRQLSEHCPSMLPQYIGPVSRRPFWLHQLAEYLIGLVLLLQGLRAPEPIIPSVAGALILINVAVARGPIRAFALVSRPVHRWFDLGVIGLLVIGAVQPWFPIDVGSRGLLIVIAGIMVLIWLNTDYRTPQRGAS
jgi:hypothetical protein